MGSYFLLFFVEGIELEKAHNLISRSFSEERDDNILRCCVCQLTFTSLYNKQSHYSGKLHLQALLQHIDDLVKQSEQSATELGGETHYKSTVVSSLGNAAADYHSGCIMLYCSTFELFPL